MSISLSNILCKHLLDKPNDKYVFISPHHYMHVKDTITFAALQKKDFSYYSEWVDKTNQDEHNTNTFQKLLKDFDISKMDPISLVYNEKLNKFIVEDGVHRLSILLHKNLISDSIPHKMLNIKYAENIIEQIKKMLSATTDKHFYNGWNNRTTYGYHSFNIHNISIPGQRNPRDRLNIVKQYIDLSNKVVFDFGCNTGGMLLHSPFIKKGVGFDFDELSINAANYISKVLNSTASITFQQQDLNTLNLSSYMNTNNIKHIDVSFLLSIGSWVKEWEKLYRDTIKHSTYVILETNNDVEGNPQLNLFKSMNCSIKCIAEASTDDMTGNKGRKTYLIQKN